MRFELLIVLGVVGAVGVGAWANPSAGEPAVVADSTAATDRRALTTRLDDAIGTVTIYRLQLVRAEAVIALSGRYRIPADRAALIFDAAMTEGVDAGLAFRLVQVESGFNAHATSRTGAIGLTQILPSTARLYRPLLTLPQLYDPETNLRLGFHFLHDLLDRFPSLDQALVAYSLGPVKVRELVAGGFAVRTPYSRSVAGGFQN